MLTSEVERRAINMERYATLRYFKRDLDLLANAISIIVIIMNVTLTITTETKTVHCSSSRLS